MSSNPPRLRHLIVVTGPPRCGTTMLAGILSRPPAYPYLPECAVLTDFIRERLRSGRSQHPLKFSAFLGDANEADRLYRNILRQVLTRVASCFDERREFLVLKDPFLLDFLDVLPRFMPWPTRIVCIVRDPRDAVNSMLEVRRRDGAPGTVSQAVDFLKPFYDRVLAAHGSDLARKDLLIVRYEDVVRKDASTLNALQHHVDYSLALDDYQGVPSAQMDLESPWHTPLYEAAITPDRVSGYRETMKKDQLAEVQNAFSSHLSAFGYEVD